jgi:hypothetical protein
VVIFPKQILPEGELFYIKTIQENPLNLSLLQEPQDLND